MESLTIHRIPLTKLRCGRFSFRENSNDEVLTRSIHKSGLLQPLTAVCEGKHFQLISGYKRLSVLKKLKIKTAPVILLESADPKELFLTALLFNSGAGYTDLERGLILSKAENDFKFSSQELVELVLPQIGLPSSPKVLAQYTQTMKLPEAVLKLIRENKLPFQGSAGLAKFKKADLDYLLDNVLRKIKPTASQLTYISEWILDLTQTGKKSAAVILKNHHLTIPTKSPDLRMVTDNFYKSLRALRFPGLAAKEKAFQDAAKSLKGQVQGLEIRAPDHFEQEGFHIQAHIRTPSDLARVLERLHAVQGQAAALFDTLL